MIKSTNTAAGVIQAWPLVGQSNWRNDYAVGFAQAGRLTREVGSYFFLNRGWRRWRGLFSHAGVIWSGGSWKVQVWFVGGRTPRRTRRWRRIPARVRIKLTRRRRRGRLLRALGYRRRRRHLTRRLSRRRHRQKRLQKAISSTGGGVSAPLSRRARQRARKASPPPAVTVKPIHKVSSRQRPHLKNYKNGHQPKDVRRIQKKILSRYPQRFSKLRRGLKSKLGRRRRLRLGKWARLMRMRRHQRRGPLLEIAQTWGTPRGGTWCWIRLGRPGYLGVATLLARMRYRLRGRIEMRARRVALPLLRSALRLRGAIGAEVRCHGRFSRRQRASHDVFRAGRLGRTQVATPREVGFATVPLRFGAVGVTLTVSYTAGGYQIG